MATPGIGVSPDAVTIRPARVPVVCAESTVIVATKKEPIANGTARRIVEPPIV
jgi:hypothetical protein